MEPGQLCAGLVGVAGGHPCQVRDPVAGPQPRLRFPMAVEAPAHRQRLLLPHHLHAVHPPMAGHTTDAGRQVGAMVEVDEIR